MGYERFGYPPGWKPTNIAYISKVLALDNRTVEEHQRFEQVKKHIMSLAEQEKERTKNRLKKRRYRDRKADLDRYTRGLAFKCGICRELKEGIEITEVAAENYYAQGSPENYYGTICPECKERVPPEHRAKPPKEKKRRKKRNRRRNIFDPRQQSDAPKNVDETI